MNFLKQASNYYDLAKKSKYFVTSSALLIGIGAIFYFLIFQIYLKPLILSMGPISNFKLDLDFLGMSLIFEGLLYIFYLNIYTFLYWIFRLNR